MEKIFIEWPGNVVKAREEQKRLAQLVQLRSLDKPVSYVAGIDVAFPRNQSVTRAAVTVLSYPALKVVEQQVCELATSLPYIPGVLSFREGNAILGALRKLTLSPDILMFDGQGIAHPMGLGIASHIGVLINKPTIGVAKSCLIGNYVEPASGKGCVTKLMIDEQCKGFVLRSKDKVKPLIVSPGHLITNEQALGLALNCLTRYRLPEPTRLADKLSKSQLSYLPS